mmetsp:Transcript_15272/g.46155  ORF Transcript_15272/g.46155 Transcript_15272/m.46155 type:complete len:862 (+) Transcript_15272:225-2810(+)
MGSPVGDWELCGERFYAREELYQMAWGDLRLDYLRVAAAPFGGPIATIRDDRKPVPLGPTGSVSTAAPQLRTYTAAGKPVASWAWDQGSIAGLGWTSSLELIVIETTGEVHSFTMFGLRLPRHFSLGAAAKAEVVAEARVFGDTLVAVTAKCTFWAAEHLSAEEGPRPQRLALGKWPREAPRSWTVLPPHQSPSGCLEIVAAAGGAAWVIDADAAAEQPAAGGPLAAVTASPDGRFVAGLAETGELSVWTADFGRTLSRHDTGSAGRAPELLAWCGSDSLVVAWEDDDSLLMVGPLGDTVPLLLPPPRLVVPEVDGARLLTRDTCQLLRRVPAPLAQIFSVGSTAPGAVLYDARELFDEHSPRADGLLRSIAAELPAAVAACVSAAVADLDPLRQAQLLKSACYGRAFVPAGGFPRDGIVSVVRRLRILNALREPEVGIPLTGAQLEALPVGQLVKALVAARHHLLATRVAEALGLGPEQVLVDWACAKISAAGPLPDDQLHAALRKKLKSAGSTVRYARIAAHAQAAGRPGLATLLLEHETRAGEQVPLLLALGEGERALDAALAGGDPDLAHVALFAALRSRPLPEFLALLAPRPAARLLFESYCADQEPELLEQLYTTTGRLSKIADMRLSEAVQAGASQSLTSPVTVSVKLLERAAELYTQSKDHPFQAKATAEFAKLRRLQAELENETGQLAFVGLSVVGTIRQALKLGNERAAQRVRSEFRVTDKRFWGIKIRALAADQQWDALDAFAQDRRSPVGLEPFIAAARAHGAPTGVVARFIARMPNGKRKAEEYASAGLFPEAAEAAAAARDGELLGRIQAAVGAASPLGSAITQIRDRLQLPGLPGAGSGASTGGRS